MQFTIGIFRGADNGLLEPVLEQPDRSRPPAAIQRRFSIPANAVDRIPRFENAINRTFREIVHEEYDPRSNRNFDQEHLRKLKTPRPFKPDYAPLVLNDAIASHLSAYPEVTPIEPARFRTNRRREAPANMGR